MAKKRGRPEAETPAHELPKIVISLTEEEKAIVIRAAKRDERPTSHWAKRVVMEAARKMLGLPVE